MCIIVKYDLVVAEQDVPATSTASVEPCDEIQPSGDEAAAGDRGAGQQPETPRSSFIPHPGLEEARRILQELTPVPKAVPRSRKRTRRPCCRKDNRAMRPTYG